MAQFTISQDPAAAALYLRVAQAAGKPVEEVLADALFKLAGELSLEAHLAAYDERFANRMDFAYRLHGLGKAEVERYLEDWSVEERAMEVLTSRARNSKNGCFRLFDRTMNNVIRLMREREQTTITETIINEASAMMLL